MAGALQPPEAAGAELAQQLVQQAYDYYTQPAPEGAPPGGMPWFDAFVDNPALPGNVCGSKDLGASEGALCFDAACALPPAASFSCKAVEEPIV